MSSFIAIENATLGNVESKATAKGTSLANFEVSVEQGFGNKKTTGTIKLTAWSEVADQLASLEAGTKLNIYGHLNARSYEWQGQTKNATDLVADAISIRFSGTASAVRNSRQEIKDEDIPF